MHKIVFFFLIFVFSISTYAKKDSTASKKPLTEKQRQAFQQKRWNHIFKLIKEETATINRVKRKSQKLMYRLFELKSEKIKLFKEKENKDFMKYAAKGNHGNKINRKKIFKKTLRLYGEAHSFGKMLLRKYPHSKYKAAIYYTLALNSRDFAYDGRELNYLQLAIRYSSKHEKVRYLATTSLAEYYYNNKKYKKAVTNYEKIIGNRDDEWLTKNLYNYGWCLLKTHKFHEAINHLEDSYQMSKNDFYVNMGEQVMTSLVSFYVFGKEVRRGIKFINKYAEDKEDSLFKLAQKSSAKGFFKETETIVDDLEKRIAPEKRAELYADLRLFQFDFYKQYHKEDKLFNVIVDMPKIKLTEYQNEDAIRKISELVGTKQIILKKDFSKHDKTYSKKTLSTIISYFDTLSLLDKKEKAQYEYFKGETYYSIERHKDALASYKSSLVSYDLVKSKNDLRAKNMDAIFSCIDLISFNKVDKKKELDFAYHKYLSYWPKNKKAQEIYPRLYALYTANQEFDKMQITLDRYIKYFPKDQKKQQDLYRVQLDLLIKAENTQLLANKINQIKKGYLKFPKKEVKKSETILASILFNRYKKMNEDGDSKEALAGYQGIHFTDYYPRSIRAEAAFNMGMIYTNLRDNNNAIKWYQKSFAFYTPKEKADKRVFLEKMALRTALLQDFLYAAKLNKFILKNFCNEKKANEKIFVNAIKNDLANDFITKVFYTLEKSKKCIRKIPNSLKLTILVHLFDNRHEISLMKFVKEYQIKNKYKTEVAHYYERFFWKYYNKNRTKQKKYYKELTRIKYEEKSKLFLNAYKKYNKLKKSIFYYKKKKIKTVFLKDPNVFSNKLQKRIQALQPLIATANDILALGHGQVSVLVYDQLTNITNYLSSEIRKYELPIKDADFQKQFKAQMNNVADNFLQQKESFKLSSQQLIEKYDLLLTRRYDSHLASEILRISDIRPQASNLAVTFGLEGKR